MCSPISKYFCGNNFIILRSLTHFLSYGKWLWVKAIILGIYISFINI